MLLDILKKKKEIIRRCCNELANEEYKNIKNKKIQNKDKQLLMPVLPNVGILADSEYPISERRRLLQEGEVGKYILSAMESIVLPYLTKVIINSIKNY